MTILQYKFWVSLVLWNHNNGEDCWLGNGPGDNHWHPPQRQNITQCFPFIYLFVAPATISKLTATNRFSKRLWLRWINKSTARFKIETRCRVFLYHCSSEGNRLSSENCGCHFHFILHVMSDKAAFVSGALLCVQRYRGNLDLYNSNGTEWICIYMPPQIECRSVGNTVTERGGCSQSAVSKHIKCKVDWKEEFG